MPKNCQRNRMVCGGGCPVYFQSLTLRQSQRPERFVYLASSGHEAPSSAEKKPEAAPATQEDAQKAEVNFYEQKEKLSDDIGAREKDANPNIAKAAKEARQKLETLTRETSLTPEQWQENLNKIRGTLNYQMNIGKFEKEREPLKKALDAQMKIQREIPMKNINRMLKSPAYVKLGPAAKNVLTTKAKNWVEAYDAKINETFFALTENQQTIQDKTLKNPDYFDKLNAGLASAVEKLQGENPLDEDLNDVDVRFNLETQNIALDDLAQRPGELDDHVRGAVERVIATLNQQAEETDAKDSEGAAKKVEQAKQYGTEALNLLVSLSGTEDRPKRAVVLANLRDRMLALIQNKDKVENSAAVEMAKGNGLARDAKGREWLSTVGVDVPQDQIPANKKADGAAEKPGATTDKPKAVAENPAEKAAKLKTGAESSEDKIAEQTVYQDAMNRLVLLESGTAEKVNFQIRIHNIDTPLQAVKNADGTSELRWASDRNGRVGYFRFDSVRQIIDQMNSGVLLQKFTASALGNKDRYKLYEADVSHVNELRRGPDGMSVSVELDWEGVVDGKGNPLITALARPHGMVEYRIQRSNIGLHGENTISGFAENFDDFMKQLRHIRNWAEESLYKSSDKNAVAREAAFRDMSNPRTYESHANRIGRTVYFGIQTTESKTDQTVKMFLDWGNSAARDANINPLIAVAVNPDGSIKYGVISDNPAFRIRKKVMHATMQQMLDDLAEMRDKARREERKAV
jgi:hypothetical protein